MKGDSPAEVFDVNNRLAHAYEDAMYLVEHASLTGVLLEEDILNPILKIKSFVQNQLLGSDGASELPEAMSVSVEEETAFWEAMSRLSAKFPDVTAGSLKSVRKPKEENFGMIRRTLRSWNLNIVPKRPAISDAKRVAHIYRYGAVFWLLLLILGQVYWIVGKDLYNECKTDLPRIINSLKYSADSLEDLEYKKYSMKYMANDIGQRMSENTGVFSGIERLIEKRELGLEGNQESREEVLRQLRTNTLDNALSTLVHEVRKEYVEHTLFNNHPDYKEYYVKIDQHNYNLRFAFAELNAWAHVNKLLMGDEQEIKRMEAHVNTPKASVNDTSIRNVHAFVQWKDGIQSENVKDNAVITRSQIILNSLSQFIFPLLFGLIGAYLFVLRSILDSVKHLTFVNGDIISYRVRLVLGSLSGLAIGFFFGESEQGAPFTISNLSPLTLSFLAGYSVDLLFTAMDTVIKRLGGVKADVGS